MKYVQRKTNVREHNRKTKHKVADVRKHERSLKSKQILGTIALGNLTYPQAKKTFNKLKPYGDIDGDGVPNKRDCRPFDVDRQDEYEDLEAERERIREEQEELVRRAAEELEERRIQEEQEETNENISNILSAQKQKERRGFWE